MAEIARAMVFHGPGQPLEPREQPCPVARPGSPIARVTFTTICGSDLHTFHGRRSVHTPTILGHEIIGTLADCTEPPIDATGAPLAIGDRITWAVAASCGGCFYCGKSIPQKCDHLRKYGHESLESGLVGGLASHCQLLPGSALVRIPDHLADEVVGPASCATATVAGLFRTGGEVRESTVLVFGAGMLGLTAAAMARSLQARNCIITDIDTARLEQARRFGATHTSTPEQLAEVVREVTAGRGVDLALEVSGSPAAMRAGLELLRIGGTFVWAGSVFPTEAVPLLPEMVVRRMLTIRGLHNYRPDDLVTAIDFLSQHHQAFPFAELVQRTYSLAEANEAFAYATQERPVRVGIRPA